MENNVKEKNNNGIIIAILCILLLASIGFICYDKLLKKEEGECPKTDCKCEEKSNSCNCSNSLDLGEKIGSVKKINITKTNQSFKIGSKEVRLRIGSDGENDNVLFVNDKYSWDAASFDEAYLTDKFIFFTTVGNLSGAIMYAIDGEGLEIPTNYNGYFADDFKIVNGYLHASGSIFCADEENGVVSDECKGKDLLVKYANNTLIVIPA